MSTGGDPSGHAPRGGQGEEDDRTFADVLNGFSFDTARRMRQRSSRDGSAEAMVPHETDDTSPPALTTESISQASSENEQQVTAWEPGHDETQSPASPVRAYAWTGGRTRSPHHFEIETLVTTTELDSQRTVVTQADHRKVMTLCRQPKSVAEVAALLSLPLGVAKVLLSDMAECGLIVVHRTATTDSDTPDRALLKRVLNGLRLI